MKTTTVKCNCDYCNKEMTESEYDQAVKVTLIIDLPHPQGKCGQRGAESMKLCSECSAKIGIENKEEYHKYIDSQNRLNSTLRSCKEKILGLFSSKGGK